MKSLGLIAVLAAALIAAPAVHAQQASAPAGSTGQCKDGTYSSQASKRGACKGHKGVKEWYSASSTAAASAPAAAASAASPAKATRASRKAASATAATSPAVAPAAAAAAATPTAATTATSGKKSAPAPSATAAPGGGPGMVWVNSSSKAYHCPGDRWYGKTKSGQYMTEAAAKAAGDHASGGKTCS